MRDYVLDPELRGVLRKLLDARPKFVTDEQERERYGVSGILKFVCSSSGTISLRPCPTILPSRRTRVHLMGAIRLAWTRKRPTHHPTEAGRVQALPYLRHDPSRNRQAIFLPCPTPPRLNYQGRARHVPRRLRRSRALPVAQMLARCVHPQGPTAK